jgi:MFS transporter, PPP family, 3-phenylpropionic acid transporter
MNQALRTGSVFAALFLTFGINLPFLPIWLKAIGLSNEQLAIALAAQSGIRVLATPILTYWADHRRARRRFIIALALFSTLGMVAVALSSQFWTIVCLLLVSSIASSPLTPMLDALAVQQSEAGHYQYGRVRMAGSLAFMLGSLLAGCLLLVLDARYVVWPIVGGYGLTLLCSLFLQAEENTASTTVHSMASPWEAARKLSSWAFIAMVLAAGLTQSSHAALYGFSSVHWQHLGHSGTVIGALWATGVIAEVVLFNWSHSVLRWLAPERLLMCGAALAVLRWFLMGFDPPLAVLYCLQILHAGSFGATHMATMHLIHRRIEPGLTGTAQGVFAAISGGILMTAALGVSGVLYDRLGAGAFLVMSAIAALGLLAACWIPRRT